MLKPKFIDDGQHGNFEQNRVQPWAPYDEFEFALARPGVGVIGLHRLEGDVLGVELEEREKIDKVALDEAQAAQVVEFARAKAQGA